MRAALGKLAIAVVLGLAAGVAHAVDLELRPPAGWTVLAPGAGPEWVASWGRLAGPAALPGALGPSLDVAMVVSRTGAGVDLGRPDALRQQLAAIVAARGLAPPSHGPGTTLTVQGSVVSRAELAALVDNEPFALTAYWLPVRSRGVLVLFLGPAAAMAERGELFDQTIRRATNLGRQPSGTSSDNRLLELALTALALGVAASVVHWLVTRWLRTRRARRR